MSRKLSYYVRDWKMTELFANLCRALPQGMPFVSSHPWAAQAALHADMKNVITMIPDNWPIAFHLAEGSVHVTQTPSAYLGYRTLRSMGPKEADTLNPIPSDQIQYTGHYVDHEIVKNIEKDCEARLRRVNLRKAKRILFNLGRTGEAVLHYRQILKREPGHAEARRALSYLENLKGQQRTESNAGRTGKQ